MSKFKVESDVAVPKIKPSKTYPFHEMNVGDSFLIYGTDVFDRNSLRMHALQSFRAFVQKNTSCRGWKITSRSLSDTEVRIWRIM